MTVRRHLSSVSLRHLALLSTAAITIILAVGTGPAQASSPEKIDGQTQLIGAEIRPDGTQGASITVTIPAKASSSRPGTGPSRPGRLCAGHPEEYGNWVNADPAARGIARIELRDCQPVTQCSGDICTITYDAGWIMHVFGKCSPTNCDWGWTAGEFRLSSGHIYGYYDQGYAKRYVFAMMSQYRPGQLWIYWRTDFTDPGRADYEMQEWFVRA